MNWITDTIAIGNFCDAQDAALLRERGIASILGLTPTLKGKSADEIGLQALEVIPLEDGPGNDPRLFLLAIKALERLAREASPVLVHCHAGRSRSVIVVAGYLMKSLGLEAEAALAQVAARREIAVTAGMERLLEHIA